MTVLEKIAEAIGEADVCGDLHEAGYMSLARAALTAMMEAGTNEHLEILAGYGFSNQEEADDWAHGWSALFQAILNEGAEK